MAANFDSYLDIPVESIERPAPPPVGHYFATIKKFQPMERNFGEGREKTPVIELTFALTSPDTDATEEGANEDTCRGKTVTKDYELGDPQGQFALRQLAEETLNLPVKGLSLRDVLAQLPNSEVKLFIDHRQGKGEREGQFFAQVKKVLSPEG